MQKPYHPLHSSSNLSQTKPRLNLSAQFVKPCQPGNALLKVLNDVTSLITSEIAGRYLERVLCDLLLSGGLRVSEVLSMSQLKVNALGQVFIFGLKGSASKLVTPIFFKSFWTSRVGVNYNPFMHISRFSFYKWLVYHNIVIQSGNGSNNSVTHAFRHLHVYLMQLMEIDNNQMSEVLGHKSGTSLKYYLHAKN